MEKEFDAFDELVSVPPDTFFRVSLGHKFWVAAIPPILGEFDFLESGFGCERGFDVCHSSNS
jgi:hypothetical protein